MQVQARKVQHAASSRVSWNSWSLSTRPRSSAACRQEAASGGRSPSAPSKSAAFPVCMSRDRRKYRSESCGCTEYMRPMTCSQSGRVRWRGFHLEDPASQEYHLFTTLKKLFLIYVVLILKEIKLFNVGFRRGGTARDAGSWGERSHNNEWNRNILVSFLSFICL